jgi:hypothetical protein
MLGVLRRRSQRRGYADQYGGRKPCNFNAAKPLPPAFQKARRSGPFFGGLSPGGLVRQTSLDSWTSARGSELDMGLRPTHRDEKQDWVASLILNELRVSFDGVLSPGFDSYRGLLSARCKRKAAQTSGGLGELAMIECLGHRECSLASASSRRGDCNVSSFGPCRHGGGDLRSRIHCVAGRFDSSESDLRCTDEP